MPRSRSRGRSRSRTSGHAGPSSKRTASRSLGRVAGKLAKRFAPRASSIASSVLSSVRGSSRSRSRSRRSTSSGTRSDNQLASGADVTATTFNRKPVKSAKMLRNMTAIQRYTYTYGTRATSIQSRQGYFTFGYDGVQAIRPGLSGYGLYNVTDLLAIQALIQGALAVGSPGINFSVERAHVDYQMVNSSNSNITLWIYDFVPRKDVYSEANNNVYPPDLAWYTGSTTTFQGGNVTQAASAQNAITDPATYPFATPFESSLFTAWYKVIRVKKLTLAPGVVHTHRVFSKQSKWIDDNELLPGSNANVAIPNNLQYLGFKTILTMGVILGEPVHAHTAPGGNNVTAGVVALDMITRKYYEYRYASPQQRNSVKFVDLPTGEVVDVITEAGQGFITELDA